MAKLAGRYASPSGNLVARMNTHSGPASPTKQRGVFTSGVVAPGQELPPLFDELVADHLNGEALEFPFRHLDVLRGHQRQSVHVRHLSIPLSERHKGAPLTRYPYPFSALYQTRPKQAKIAIYVL